jgi:heat shock protein HtpX
VVVIAAVFFAVQLFASDKIALAAMGAKEVSVAQAPELHSIIERLCVQADLPKPRVAIINAPMPNACALGRSQKTATVCVTTGLMQLLEPAELEGVLAHELTHVINRDVMVMTIASFFASIAAILVRFGFFFGGFGGATATPRARSRPCCSCRSPSTRSRSCCCGRCRATASTPPTAAPR